MNILVTGGCGYVGTNLVNKLLEEGYIVRVVDVMWFGNFLQNHKNLVVIKKDIRNIDEVSIKGIDTIIHLASIANDPTSELDPKLTWETNVLAVMRLVEMAINCGVKQFIYASSGSVYGVRNEPQVTEDFPPVPMSDYNKTKMVAECVLLSYKDSILIQIVRPGTICGYSPRMRLDLTINMFTMQALTKRKITVFGGRQMRPNIHMKEMVNLYLYFLRRGREMTGIYNAGFENMSVMDIAKKIMGLVPAEIIVSGANDPRSYCLSSEKLLSTGFCPQYGIIDGIKDIIEAYKSGILENKEQYYNIKVMKRLFG